MPENQAPSAVVVQANKGDVVLAYVLGFLSGGPAGCLIAPQAIKAFGGKYGPWIFVGIFAGPTLWLIQMVILGSTLSIPVTILGAFPQIGKSAQPSEVERIEMDNERLKALVDWSNRCVANEKLCGKVP